MTDDQLFTVWDEHYADVLSHDRPSFDPALLRAALAASMASQATAELPKPASYWYHEDATGTQVAEPSPIFTADQMNAHYLAGVEAGRASRAQSEGAEIVTQADVNRARELILDATSTDLLSGDRKVRKADRAIVYGWLCEAANVLVGEVPATPGATK
jgi:hypothetical protein